MALFLIASASGCAPDKDSLDTAQATAVLATQIPTVVPFFRASDDLADNSNPSEAGVYKTLLRDKILRAYTAPSLLGTKPQTHFRLTFKGAALAGSWTKAGHGVYEVSVGTFRLDRVTAVEMLAPRHAMVSYTYSLDLNAMGRLLLRAGEPGLNYFDRLESRSRDIRTAGTPTADTAEITLSDDGWKSEKWVP